MKLSLFFCDFLLIVSLMALITCGPEPLRISTEAVVPFAFIASQNSKNLTTASDTTQFLTCDTVHTGDTLSFIGMAIPQDHRITRVQWNFDDGTTDSLESVKHSYLQGGMYKAKFFIFYGTGNFLYDSVLVYVNTSPDSVHLVTPPKDTSFTSSPVTLTWKGFDQDRGDSTLFYLAIINDGTKSDTILNWKKDTSVIFNQKVMQESKITWSVTAKDLFGDTVSSMSSVFYIKPVYKDTSDILLSKLKISSGTLFPKFADTVFSYIDTLPPGTASVTITAIPRDSTSTVSINDIPIVHHDSTSLVMLQGGKQNTIYIKVTSKQSTSKTYTLSVIPASIVVTDTIYLCSLAVSSGTLYPNTLPPNDSLRDTVLYTIPSITFRAVANDPEATIRIGSSDSIISGGTSKPIPLNAGNTTIVPIKVVHHNGKRSKTYTVSVYRSSNPGHSACLAGVICWNIFIEHISSSRYYQKHCIIY